MGKKCMANPKAFVKDCKKIGVTFELLIEAQESLTKQGTAKLFNGKAKRGGGGFCSAVSIENWIETFIYVREHPDEEDDDSFQPRDVIPNENWYKFVEAVKVPIEHEVVESWKKMSKSALGKEAKKYNYLNGIANTKALNTIHERMYEMVERRRKNIWEKLDDPIEENEETNYKLMNILQLKEIAKEYGISTNLKKEELIDEIKSFQEKDIVAVNYEDMSVSRLKVLSKERGLTEYNNLKKEELIINLKKKDEEDKKEEEKQDSITLGGIEIISRSEDGYINATRLCKAGGKEYSGWFRNSKTSEFLDELEGSLQICRTELIKVNNGGVDQHTWVHPRVAIHIAQWISPKFAVLVTGWIHTLLSTGKAEIDKSIRSLSNFSQYDTEAIQIEKRLNMEEYTSTSVIYMSYIGKGMVKIGYSDSALLNRTKKHTSTESMYSQWCFVNFIKVSGKPVEALLHKFLFPYQTDFNKQKEIYKLTSSIESFIEIVNKFVEENDLPMKIAKLEKETNELKLKLLELQNENLRLKLQIK